MPYRRAKREGLELWAVTLRFILGIMYVFPHICMFVCACAYTYITLMLCVCLISNVYIHVCVCVCVCVCVSGKVA